MIKKTKIWRSEDIDQFPSPDQDYVEVTFDDGTFVALNEEELKNAAILAEKGCLDG